ncbi:type III-A CRISPR-associated RAMP protein Csm4 [Conservatibacter flavescens]|uniref:CRISPR system Cms protein Csm4 n=1 Tax=Conservatibacter flavescens TaxID=28161 RepID=A0A2M8S3C0_9PAST|nr:RAMP superfamily CRISPR-associated protein [Conservatibacter flavescens]PJG85616.1 CRISPR-associated protein Csm4 [Conservatibacter flavescens]
MKTYRFTLKLNSAFGTPLVGDSLFGQICWEIVHQFGENKLTELLDGYTNQRPFLVVSDAFPNGYLPLPCLPSKYWVTGKETDRKVLKKKQWISLEERKQAVENWQTFAKAEKDLFEKIVANQPHNTLDRQTNTTGEGQFAPYSTSQIWYSPNTQLDLYCVIDESRLSISDLKQLLNNIGQLGFGRDASIGLGRFEIENVEPFEANLSATYNAYLTLANCAPQGLDLHKDYCFYQLTTRFGRHGDIKALSENPFKKPIILAKAGAVFTPHQWQARLFLGNGLSGISKAQPNAVHQGYAPIIPIHIDLARLG